ncbi:MAG: dTMP kinase [Chloroflexi bacterium RBG_16_58_8]|nr:MAG: dTMP kinase [Chloroflexi bacterium RBG_16_58_8]
MALFITFEGVEGCGKSTQSRLLYRRLQMLAIPALLTHEPGVTPLGKRITRLLKWVHEVAISPPAELLLFNASRAQLVEEMIRPALGKGIIVICDRYADSTAAYQGYGRGLDLNAVRTANGIGTQGLVPDLTILLDLPVMKGLHRKQGKKTDRFERESRMFHERVRKGYLELAKKEPGRWLVIDAEKSKDEIAGIIWQRVNTLLPRKNRN